MLPVGIRAPNIDFAQKVDAPGMHPGFAIDTRISRKAGSGATPGAAGIEAPVSLAGLRFSGRSWVRAQSTGAAWPRAPVLPSDGLDVARKPKRRVKIAARGCGAAPYRQNYTYATSPPQ